MGKEEEMIKDKLKNAKIYYSLSNDLKKGFEWLNTNDLNSLKDGRYERFTLMFRLMSQKLMRNMKHTGIILIFNMWLKVLSWLV